MDLTPVESPHIAAIGYLEAERVLLVRYHDGSLYAFEHFPPFMWEQLVKAPSKGKFLSACRDLQKGILITKGGNADNQQIEPARATGPVEQTGPLNVIDPEADKCCRASLTASLAKYPAAQIMACGKCGQEFVPGLVEGVRLWRCKPAFAIHRRS